jgi:hypothetical protein
MISPRHDAPVRPELMSYVVSRLRAVGIPVNRAWLDAVASEPLSPILLSGDAKLIEEARKRVPQSKAFWELGPFFQCAMPPAAFDIGNGPFENFEEFSFLYECLLGAEAKPWFHALYLAAAAMPGLTAEAQVKLINAFDADSEFAD